MKPPNKSRWLSYFFVAFCAGVSLPAVPSNNVAFSENRRFFVEASQFVGNMIQLAVFDNSTGDPKLVWNTKLGGALPSAGGMWSYFSILVSDDGKSIIYHENSPWNEMFLLHKDFLSRHWSARDILQSVEKRGEARLFGSEKDLF